MWDNSRRKILTTPTSCIWPLIVLNIIVFIFCQIGGSGQRLLSLLELHPFYIRRWELWRLVTYMFVHGGVMHIFFNMWGIYIFGRPVENALGTRRFLILFFVSGIIGGLFWLLVNWNMPVHALIKIEHQLYQLKSDVDVMSFLRENPDSTLVGVAGGVVGASGALFGILVASAMAFPSAMVTLLFPPVTMKLRTMVICYMVIEVLSSFNSASGIAHLAHLGGALGGFLYMRRLRPTRFSRAPGFWHRLKSAIWRRGRKAHAPSSHGPYKSLHTLDDDVELMRVLDKLSNEGYDKLTESEKNVLNKAGEHFDKH